MAKTLLQIRTRVLHVLQEEDDYFDIPSLDLHINAALSYYHDLIAETHENFFEEESLFDVVASVRDIPLDDDVENVIQVEHLRNEEFVLLTNFPQTSSHSNESSTPYYYELIENSIRLYPKPELTVDDGLRIKHTTSFIDLAADGDLLHRVYNGSGEKCVIYRASLLAKGSEELYDGRVSQNGIAMSLQAFERAFLSRVESRSADENIDPIDEFMD